jgi:hypothetical protein
VRPPAASRVSRTGDREVTARWDANQRANRRLQRLGHLNRQRSLIVGRTTQTNAQRRATTFRMSQPASAFCRPSASGRRPSSARLCASLFATSSVPIAEPPFSFRLDPRSSFWRRCSRFFSRRSAHCSSLRCPPRYRVRQATQPLPSGPAIQTSSARARRPRAGLAIRSPSRRPCHPSRDRQGRTWRCCRSVHLPATLSRYRNRLPWSPHRGRQPARLIDRARAIPNGGGRLV